MRTALLLTLTLSVTAVAADPARPAAKPAPAKKKKTAVPAFTMPSLGEVPKADGAARATTASDELSARAASSEATYSVVKVAHAKQFSGSANGAVPVSALEAVRIKGNPAQTEKFSSVIRVKSPQRIGAPIDVVILDARGDTAMTASGELTYRGAKGDEAEWIVDWDPSPVRGPGQYSVLVRVAGQPMGTWPLVLVPESR
jgi:hypothetical protein